MLGEYDGSALILIGIVLIALSAVRFVRTGRMIDDEQTHPARNIRTELALSLVLIMAALAAYVALD
jgi:inner membrane protein YidH